MYASQIKNANIQCPKSNLLKLMQPFLQKKKKLDSKIVAESSEVIQISKSYERRNWVSVKGYIKPEKRNRTIIQYI